MNYPKAFDSIRQGKIIEALIHYKIHYKIIDAIANIYRNDYTEVEFGELKKRNKNYKWNKTRLYWINYYFQNCDIYDNGRIRYNDEHIKIKLLLFADDALL